MSRINNPICVILVLFTAGCSTVSNLVDDGSKSASQGEYIFNGRNLNGWQMVGAGAFHLENGSLRTDGGPGILWYAESRFVNFSMSLEWKSNRKGADSGVLIRIPEEPGSYRHAKDLGAEIQIQNANEDPLQRTGAVAGISPSTHLPLHPQGEWNQLRIISREHVIDVWVNKEHVCTAYTGKSPFGYIGLENHDADSIVWFRNITIQPLP